MTIREAREKAEAKAGKRLTDEQYAVILAYTFHKAKTNGKGQDYVPILLMDEIKNHFFQEDINAASRRMVKEIRKMQGQDAVMQGIMMALQEKGLSFGV